MNGLSLTKRLRAILSEIPDNVERIADIGAGHGKAGIAAMLLGKAKRAYCIDKSADSIEVARRNAEKAGAEGIEFLNSDGFREIASVPIDCAIIAGLGGRETEKLLREPHICETYVLSPHKNVRELRECLADNGFVALKDYIVEDGGRHYPIIVARKGESDYSEDELSVGKNRPPSPDFEAFLAKRLRIASAISKKTGSAEHIKETEALERCLNSERERSARGQRAAGTEKPRESGTQ